jgi:hypothetical protein
VKWNERMQKAAQQKEKPAAASTKQSPASKNSSPETQASKASPIDKEKQKEQKRLEKRFNELEQLIEALQSQKAEAEQMLADPSVYSNGNTFTEAEKKYKSVTEKLKLAESEYEKIFESMSN